MNTSLLVLLPLFLVANHSPISPCDNCLWAKVTHIVSKDSSAIYDIEEVVEEWNYSNSIMIQNIPFSLTISDLWERVKTLWSQVLKPEKEEEESEELLFTFRFS